ncbi:MAG: ABC transporter ATP-binding protein [Armatimonadota bacterium]
MRLGFSRILRGISFCAEAGELVGILGPSGSGKSTLLNVLSGWMRPSGGEVRIGGQSLRECLGAGARVVGYVPQEDIVHRQLPLHKALVYAGLLRLPELRDHRQIGRRADAIVRLLGLQDRAKAPIGTLSGGERKRANIGVELVTKPRVLLLDEPTSGLDPALEEKMMRLFRRLADGGRTVIASTHVMGTLEVLDMMLVLAKGRGVYFGPAAEASGFFRVGHPAEIYKRLASEGDRKWERRFRSSRFYAEYVERRLRERPRPTPATVAAGTAELEEDDDIEREMARLRYGIARRTGMA